MARTWKKKTDKVSKYSKIKKKKIRKKIAEDVSLNKIKTYFGFTVKTRK